MSLSLSLSLSLRPSGMEESAAENGKLTSASGQTERPFHLATLEFRHCQLLISVRPRDRPPSLFLTFLDVTPREGRLQLPTSTVKWRARKEFCAHDAMLAPRVKMRHSHLTLCSCMSKYSPIRTISRIELLSGDPLSGFDWNSGHLKVRYGTKVTRGRCPRRPSRKVLCPTRTNSKSVVT